MAYRSRSRFKSVIVGCMVLGDLLAVVFGFLISLRLYESPLLTDYRLRGEHDFGIYVWVALGCAAFLLMSLSMTRSYDQTGSILNIDEVTAVTKSLLWTTLGVFAVTFAARDLEISRLVLGVALVHMALGIGLSRWFLYSLARRLHKRGYGVERVAVYGVGQTGVQLARRMRDAPSFGFLPVCFLDDNPDQHGNVITVGDEQTGVGIPVVGGEEALQVAVLGYGISEVILAIPGLSLERLRQIIARVKQLGMGVKYVALVAHVPFRTASFENLAEFPLVGEREFSLSWTHRLIKRVMDLTLSILALAIFAVPIAIIAAAIRLSSAGPALFVQERVGQGGRRFRMYKFRTMYTDASAYAETPRDQTDARITPLGRLLRKTSLDELPQFFNVLVGDMSIVGPRPEMPFIVAKYDDAQRERLRALPGITGLWQISADRHHPIHENLDYDLYYIQNQTILMDVVIAFQTVVFAFRGI